MTGQELFEEVIRLTGVSDVLAPGMIKRSLADGGVAVDSARAEDYEVALPKIRARLKAYVTPEEAEQRTKQIAQRLASLRHAPKHTPSTPARRDRLEGEREKSGEKDLPSRSGSGEKDLIKVMPPTYELDETDTTLHGRRWTADEQAALDAMKQRERK